jgi:leucyl aminopeptidase
MQVSVKKGSAVEVRADLLAIPFPKLGAAGKRSGGKGRGAQGRERLPRGVAALDRALGGLIGAALASGDFTGTAEQTLLLYPAEGSGLARILLVGMGPVGEINAERLRRVGAAALQGAHAKGISRVTLVAPSVRKLTAAAGAAALAEGAVLGAYRFDTYRTLNAKGKARAASPRVTLLCDGASGVGAQRAAVRDAVIAAESQCLARDLSNEPPNALPPSALARAARALARQTGLSCRVMRVAELEKKGLTALLAVGQGSANPPHLIVLEHKGRGARAARSAPACIVGKGITFDSGGISLKPAANMGDMKHDMSGAAAVMGLMRAVALQDHPGRVIGVIAAAENMPSGTAYRPGDIVRTLSGKTIEITNTDAEGRVVLADALTYALDTYRPEVVVDIATLTGAAMVALGPWATAACGNDEALLGALKAAGEETHELIWPMPMLREHRIAMGSRVADLKNSGGRDAGLSTAAAFLSEFVDETPWAHLDIAGSGWTTTRTPYHTGGATGVTVRALLAWLKARAA